MRLKNRSSLEVKILSNTEHKVSAETLRKAVKHVARQTESVVSAGISTNQGLPYEQRRADYQQTLLQQHERLRHLRTLNLASEPLGVSASRERKNKIVLAAGKVSEVSVVATTGIAYIVAVPLIASSPLTAVLGGITGMIAAPFVSEHNVYFRGDTVPKGKFSYINISLAGLGNGALAGCMVPGMIVYEIFSKDDRYSPFRVSRIAKKALNFLNYMPKAEQYANRPRLSTREIADSAYDKLHQAFLDDSFDPPKNEQGLDPTFGESAATPILHANGVDPDAELAGSHANQSTTSDAPDASSSESLPTSSNVPLARPKKSWRFFEREENAPAFNVFQRHLRETEAYSNKSSRSELIARMDKLVTCMHEDCTLRYSCFQVAVNIRSRSDEGIISALSKMEEQATAWESKKNAAKK
ncbi:MAG: NEL-type E3 ubiquitin ligase domain-containing protein [Pseudomonadota bacterium]